MRLKEKPEKKPQNPLRALNYLKLLLRFRQRSGREISQRLTARGFSAEEIASTIKLLKKEGIISEDSPQADSAQKIANQMMQDLSGIDPKKAKQKVYNYLLRRGFSSEEISEALDNL